MIWTDGLAEYEWLNQQVYRKNLARVMRKVLPSALPSQQMSMLDWLEANFVYPTGPKRGQRYDRRDQPATTLFLQLIDDPYWRSAVLVAPNQSGKTLSLVQYVFNSLFNLRDGIIFGVPDVDKMWNAKWHRDFLPAINASASLRSQLPSDGAGSKGGTPGLVMFNNGESLMVMGAGSGDTQRAGATSKKLVVTEFHAFGKASTGSFEGSKLDQLKRRLLAYMSNSFFLGESTLTTDKNIAWTSFLTGTQTLVHFPCECCDEFIAPEREHLVGWQDARTEEEARDKTRFSCPVCGILMDDSTRRRLLQEAKALHNGQTVDRGNVIGDVPPTRNLSFRFSASTHMFSDSGFLGVEEWSNLHQPDSDKKKLKEHDISQGLFAWPVNEDDMRVDPLDGHALMERAVGSEFGTAPAGTTRLWGGVDVRKTQMHYTIIATRVDGGPRFIAWGHQRILQDIPLPEAILQAAGILQDKFRNGFQVEGTTEMMPVTLTLMDSGYEQWTVFAACDLDDFWMPLKGQGAGVLKDEKYKAPTNVTGTVKFIGDRFDVKRLQDRFIVHQDASVWKSKLHAGLRKNIARPDAITFANAPSAALRELIAHLTAEKEGFLNDSGESTSTWSRATTPNHLLDTSAYALLAPAVWEFIREHIEPEEQEVWQPPRGGDGTGLFG